MVYQRFTSFVPTTLFLFRSRERIPCIRASFCDRDVRTRATSTREREREMLVTHPVQKRGKNARRSRGGSNRGYKIEGEGGRVRDTDVRFDRKGMQTVKGGKISLLDPFENSSPPGRRPFICRFRGARAQKSFTTDRGGLVWLRFLIHSIFNANSWLGI